jgi:phage shock protein C
MGRKLRRSKKVKVISGVCGGIAEFFDIDVTIVRLGFLLATFFGGMGPVVYIVMSILMPENEGYTPNNFFDDDKDFSDSSMGNYDSDKDFTHVMGDSMDYSGSSSKKSSTFLGVCLIVFGGILLLKQFVPNINFIELLPILFVLIGFVIVFRSGRR